MWIIALRIAESKLKIPISVDLNYVVIYNIDNFIFRRINMKKILSVILALCMVFSLCTFVSADGDKLLDGKIVFLFTNDIHGRGLHTDSQVGYSGIAQAKKNLQDQGAYVLLFDAGDAAQGTPLVNLSSGANAVEFMNLAGYDAACPGNHELDWGIDNLQIIEEAADYQFLCASIVDHISGESIFKERTIFETPDGFKVGVFAVDTPECQTKTHPDKIRGIDFLSDEALVQCTQAQIDALRNDGAQFVICLGHLGVSDESVGNRSTDLIPQVEGIDLFIDGHSHTSFDKGENVGDTLLVSTGCYGAALGYAVYEEATAEDGTVSLKLDETGLMEAGNVIKNIMAHGAPAGFDADIEAKIAAVNDDINAELGKPFAVTEVLLNGERAPGNRTEETNLGDFACDAILWAANQYSPVEVVAAVTNGGGIRATVEPGDISMLDLKSVFPFGNSVAVLTVTGAELLEVLEAATFSLPDAIGGFPQVSGIVYTIDTSVEWVQGEQYPDSTYYAPAEPGARVTIESVGGEPFDAEALYTIATNDFCAAGGDQYYAFKYSYATAGNDTGLALEDALVKYVSEVKDGVVGQEYAEPQGRITVK